MYQRILVPTDGSATASKGLTEAVTLAKLTGGRIRLLHVVDTLPIAIGGDGMGSYAADLIPFLRKGGQAILDQALKGVESEGVPVEATLREVIAGRVCDVVVEEASTWKADLIVLGTHGRRGVRRMLLGSDAEQVLRSAAVPVLLVRGE
jgi:nucleotide-binding universal stress UspA family protein